MTEHKLKDLNPKISAIILVLFDSVFKLKDEFFKIGERTKKRIFQPCLKLYKILANSVPKKKM